jgi:hypothetical protein
LAATALAAIASIEVSAHRNLRGPYTAAGELIRRLLPQAVAAPGLIEAHRVTLLVVCPDLAAELTVPPDLAAWLRLSREGNARSWSTRLAHGLTDFLLAYAAWSSVPLAVSFADAEEADALDREFLSVLARRADPQHLSIRILTPQEGEGLEESAPQGDDFAMAREYVASECTSRRPSLKRSYARLDEATRRQLHRERCDALRVLNRDVDLLGALPFHCEQAAADPEPLLQASTRCMHLAYYEGARDWSLRGRAMTVSYRQDARYAAFARNLLYSSLLLGHYAEVEAVCAEITAHCADTALLANAAYAKAILNARLYGPARRDLTAARGWVEKALELTETLPLPMRGWSIWHSCATPLR